jgi:hypothetical protein
MGTGIRKSLLALAAACGLTLCVPAGAAAIGFTPPQKLSNSPPKGDLQGGEPSVAIDRDGRHVYVVAPGGGENGGVGYWRSKDGGRSFSTGRSLGSILGGGDSDVDIGPDHTVYIADLEVPANALCRSFDYGKTFDASCDTGVASNQTGFESDREWVNPDPDDPNVVYFSYHDFVGEYPLVWKSTSGGAPGSFIPCGPVLKPASDAWLNFVPGGTDQGKMLVASDGSLYVPITEPTNPATVLDDYNNFYVAIARDGCGPSTVFRNSTVYSNANANLANIFSYVVQDGGGNVYALATGKTGREGKHFGVYVFVSRNHGKTWSTPVRVDPKGSGATALGSIAGGPKTGDIAVGYYQTNTTKNPDAQKNVWRFRVAQSRNAGRTWKRTTVTKKPIHYGGVCNTGILCLSGRNLLDFSSVTVNPRNGCVFTTFAGDGFNPPADPEKNPAAPYVARQKSGCF